jgi:hypothetical protein
MFTKEQLEQIQRMIDEAVTKDREERKQSVERIVKHLNDIEQNGKKRYDVLFPFAEKVVELEQSVKMLEKLLEQRAKSEDN